MTTFYLLYPHRHDFSVSVELPYIKSLIAGVGTNGMAPTWSYRICHPCMCRLRETGQFNTSSPTSLVGASCASFIVGIFTIFRLTPFFLLSLVFRIEITKESKKLNVYKVVVLSTMFTWLAVLVIVFFIFGFFLLISIKTKKRWMALLHPWGLLLVYMDLFFWLTLTVFFHYGIIVLEAHKEISFNGIHPPIAFFLLIYIDLFCYTIIYWGYGTYFIVAELTVIEKFF